MDQSVDFRAEDAIKLGKTLTFAVFSYESEFRFTIADGETKLTCALNPSSAKALSAVLGDFFSRPQLTKREKATNLSQRLIDIVELIEAEPEPNHLALVSFVAGYSGYKIAP